MYLILFYILCSSDEFSRSKKKTLQQLLNNDNEKQEAAHTWTPLQKELF